MAKVAFVTGGNGISGSAIVEHLVHKTSAAEWSRIIVTSLSPLATDLTDSRLEFLQLDFTRDPTHLAARMRASCGGVTHAFFTSYAHRHDFAELNAVNTALFSNFLTALLAVAPRLANLALQTGGKHYNLHLHAVPTPARESDPRLGDPSSNFYHLQEDLLFAAHASSNRSSSSSSPSSPSWTYTIIRPEAIIGPSPKPNGMNSALTLAVYFRLCAALGEPARMPTNARYWEGAETVSDSGLLADFTLWASSTSSSSSSSPPSDPNLLSNQAFNLVNGDHFVWRYMWPRLAACFGAEATEAQMFSEEGGQLGPASEGGEGGGGFGAVGQEFSLVDWAGGKREAWEALCEREGKPGAKAAWDAATWGFQDWVFRRTWNSTLGMGKARACGWTGYKDSYESWVGAFERVRGMGLIP